MRCYHLNNFYLHEKHCGIQSAHSQHELMLKYTDPSNPTIKSPFCQPQLEGYLEWARNHKTIIVLNGGMQSHLQEWVEFLTPLSHSYAWAKFNESEEALNGALTNVAVVLPERIYTFARQITNAIESGRSNVIRSTDFVYIELFRLPGDNYKLVRKSRAVVTEEFVEDEAWLYNQFDVQLMDKLSKCSLM